MCVVISHCIPKLLYDITLFRVWGDMQVPLFILIQVFHAYKHKTYPQLNFKKMVRRIIIPFVVIQVLIMGGYLLLSDLSMIEIGGLFIINGGIGPGSYYPWVYVQMYFILIFLYPIIKKTSLNELAVLLIMFSVLIEVLFSVFDGSDKLYRLTCLRYLFLIYLGMLWVEKGIDVNRKTMLLSFLTLLITIFLTLTSYNLEPFFFNTRWRTHRWICYYYVAIVLPYILFYFYRIIKKWEKIECMIKLIARSSYEIFLFQMFVFALSPFTLLKVLNMELLWYQSSVLYILITTIISVIGGILLNKTRLITY